MGESCIVKQTRWLIKNESLVLKVGVAVCAVILLGVLIGLGKYGIDLSNVFFGTPWNSPLPHARGEIAIEGGIVAITLLFGGLLLSGILALAKKNGQVKEAKESE